MSFEAWYGVRWVSVYMRCHQFKILPSNESGWFPLNEEEEEEEEERRRRRRRRKGVSDRITVCPRHSPPASRHRHIRKRAVMPLWSCRHGRSQLFGSRAHLMSEFIFRPFRHRKHDQSRRPRQTMDTSVKELFFECSTF